MNNKEIAAQNLHKAALEMATHLLAAGDIDTLKMIARTLSDDGGKMVLGKLILEKDALPNLHRLQITLVAPDGGRQLKCNITTTIVGHGN
jgi:hypothetical protein